MSQLVLVEGGEMDCVKRFGLTAVAAMALMAFRAGGASAAELYSTGVTVPAGTTISLSLEAGTSAGFFTTDAQTIVDTCTGNTAEGTIGTYSGGNANVSLNALSFSGCAITTDTLTKGTLAFDASGKVTDSGSVVTYNTGITCRYGFITGTLSTGKIPVNAVTDEREPKALLCPDTTRWVASYVVTSPHDLTVE